MRAYRRVVRTVSDQYGKNDVRLIEPLVALAYAAARVPGRRLTGKRAIGRAVQTAREHAEGSPELLARTLVEEGDWYASQSAKRRFRRPYGEGWDILDEDPALQPVRDALFAAPTRLSLPLLCTIYGLRMDETASPELYPDSGYIDAVFDVDENGRPVNVRIVDASPSGLMNVHVRYQIGRFRYRPACGNGRPRPFTGLSYRHEFRYYASSLTEQERDLIATTTNGTDAAPERASPGDGEPSP